MLSRADLLALQVNMKLFRFRIKLAAFNDVYQTKQNGGLLHQLWQQNRKALLFARDACILKVSCGPSTQLGAIRKTLKVYITNFFIAAIQ